MENQGNQDRFDSLHDQYAVEGKTCTKCLVDKSSSEFSARLASSDGLTPVCKQCKREYDRAYRKHPMAKDRIEAGKASWRVSEKGKAYHHNYYVKSREDGTWSGGDWGKDHPEEMKVYRRKWAEKDKVENPNRSREYAAGKRKGDIQFRLKDSLRARLNVAIKQGFKGGSAVRDLGCSIEELKKHLESKFKAGMTWDNWGRGPGNWNIDHIFPLAIFDLTNRQHVVLVCHYLNLQPLWSEDNASKGDKVPQNVG